MPEEISVIGEKIIKFLQEHYGLTREQALKAIIEACDADDVEVVVKDKPNG